MPDQSVSISLWGPFTEPFTRLEGSSTDLFRVTHQTETPCPGSSYLYPLQVTASALEGLILPIYRIALFIYIIMTGSRVADDSI